MERTDIKLFRVIGEIGYQTRAIPKNLRANRLGACAFPKVDMLTNAVPKNIALCVMPKSELPIKAERIAFREGDSKLAEYSW